MSTQQIDVLEGEFRPVFNICGLSEGAKIRLPAYVPITFFPHLSPPNPGSKWDYVDTIACTSLLPPSTSPSLTSHLSATWTQGCTYWHCCLLSGGPFGEGPTQVLEAGLRQGISGSLVPRGKCGRGRVLVLSRHVPLGLQTLLPFGKDIEGGR